jgi:RNA polymerase sigma-70 factor (ECF subfamily)
MTPRRLARLVEDPDADAVADSLDAELVARAGRGDDAAFEQLARRWSARVRDYLLRVTGEAAAVDDLLQEVLIALYRSAPSNGSLEARFAVRLFCIARNVALSYLRKRAARGRLFDLIAAAPRALLARFERRAPRSPPDELIRDEFAAAFDVALRRLPEEFRTIFLLREREQMSYEEIAAVVGIPAKTVSTRLVRAREKLRRALAAWNVTSDPAAARRAADGGEP